MLNLTIGVVGAGNAGGQVATEANSKYDIPSVVLNASAKDLNVVEGATILVGSGEGTGKNRDTAKEYLEIGIQSILQSPEFQQVVVPADIVFMVSSEDGGYGSGTIPTLTNILSRVYPNKIFIVQGIKPPLTESVAAQDNTLEYMDELVQCPNVAYMLYDNGKYTGAQADIFRRVNEDMVKDMLVLQGVFNLQTNLASIDERDMKTIIRAGKRIVVGRLETLSTNDIKQSLPVALRQAIENSSHVDIEELPKLIPGIGVIYNLESKFNDHVEGILAKVQEEFNPGVVAFEHARVNTDDSVNQAYIILSGLDAPVKRINAIRTKVEEMTELVGSNQDLTSLFSYSGNKALKQARGTNNSYAGGTDKAVEVDMGSIFSQLKKH